MKRIGAGGMGEVFLDQREGRTVVVKRMHRALAAQSGFVEKFLAEAKALASVSHPNVVRVIGFGESDGQWELIMEWVDGVDLRTAALDLAAKVRVAIELADALDAVHRAGLIHGDVSPHNVLVERSGRAVLIDFGIATAKNGSPLPTGGEGQGEGKIAYAAPESLLEDLRDPLTDQFSLGVTLWELFSSRRAFDRDSDVEIINAVTEERLARADAPAGIADVIERMTDRVREERFESLGEAADQLRAEAKRLRLALTLTLSPAGERGVGPSIQRTALSPVLASALEKLSDAMTTEDAESVLGADALDLLEDLLAAGALRAEDTAVQRRFFIVT